MVQSFLKAVENGDKSAAASLVSFPLRVNFAASKMLNREQFLRNFNDIFTPAEISCLRQFAPHNMFVSWQGVMLGNGDLWFNDKGLVAINPCAPSTLQ
jgi:hypothetical protein